MPVFVEGMTCAVCSREIVFGRDVWVFQPKETMKPVCNACTRELAKIYLEKLMALDNS